MALLPNYYRWYVKHLLKHIAGNGCILGVGAGFEADLMLPLSNSLTAVDYNPELLSKLNKRIQSKKLSTAEVDLRSDWNELPAESFDYIAAFDVLEHFDDDNSFVQKARARLAKRGKLLIKVPACSDLFSEMDEASGHFRRYDKEALCSLLEQNNFKIVSARYFNPIAALAYRLRRHRKSNFSTSFNPNTLRAINIGILFLPFFDFCTVLFRGLSLVVVAERIEK
jgi:SAM-dependent methyltransferase